eukprot:CAMPEP_0170543704 /NCGR_PEP_ID=MMETSP0211-20121228/2728_1 /TAXON_ID=311385 /ORGANISM="Pseudokeronopsis sp., Strain OXSARD2" /LENGTH=52 /DNA_ID=CAMNT_0010847151 /DNA_START=2582 /DNA_END=2740 /DNA_ORIENTATION=-
MTTHSLKKYIELMLKGNLQKSFEKWTAFARQERKKASKMKRVINHMRKKGVN